jgi:hypothetical protein
MNKTLHKILELCDSEELNLTHFSYTPRKIGSTITIELQVDDRAKVCEGE